MTGFAPNVRFVQPSIYARDAVDWIIAGICGCIVQDGKHTPIRSVLSPADRNTGR